MKNAFSLETIQKVREEKLGYIERCYMDMLWYQRLIYTSKDKTMVKVWEDTVKKLEGVIQDCQAYVDFCDELIKDEVKRNGH